MTTHVIFTPPIAAIGIAETIGLLFLVISFIVWVINQANSQKVKNLNERKQQRPQRPPAQAAPGQQARRPRPPAQQAPQDPEAAIEEFLRRAAQQKPAQRPPVQQAIGPPAMVAQAEEWAEEKDEYAEDVSQYEEHTGVAAHVKEYMDKDRFETSDLTDLDQVDEQLEARLHATFGREIGTLAPSTVGGTLAQSSGASVAATVATAEVTAAAAGVAAMLSDSRHLASAIVMQEILRRPEI